MKPHESPRINKNQFVAIRAIRGLCGIGVLSIAISIRYFKCFINWQALGLGAVRMFKDAIMITEYRKEGE